MRCFCRKNFMRRVFPFSMFSVSLLVAFPADMIARRGAEFPRLL
jgi:hypothetical protein